MRFFDGERAAARDVTPQLTADALLLRAAMAACWRRGRSAGSSPSRRQIGNDAVTLARHGAGQRRRGDRHRWRNCCGLARSARHRGAAPARPAASRSGRRAAGPAPAGGNSLAATPPAGLRHVVSGAGRTAAIWVMFCYKASKQKKKKKKKKPMAISGDVSNMMSQEI